MHNENIRLDHDEGNRREVAHRIEGQLRKKRGIGRQGRGASHQQGIAIGRRFRRVIGAHVATGARAVLDDE